MNRSRELYWTSGAFFLYAAVAFAVLGHQVGGAGALASPGALLVELNAVDLDHPWAMGERPPFCYRPLFRWLVLAAYEHVPHEPERFFRLFVAASYVSLLAAAGAFHALLAAVGFTRREAVAAVLLFLTSFPVLFSHDMPVHTREDLLGYASIALTLIAVARDRPIAVALLGALGATIRETCLLGVLPYALVSRQPLRWQAVAYGVPGATWLLLRAAIDAPAYDYLGVSTSPTLDSPVEALLYLFATFGALWVAAGLRLVDSRPPRHPLLAPRVVLLALAAVAATGWTLGMVRENRITYVLFPFVIPLAVDFFRSPEARPILRARAGWIAGAAVLLLGAAGLRWLAEDPHTRVPALRTVIGDSFHPGVVPVVVHEVNGVEVEVELAHASAANGPVVLLHLAASAWLLVGAWATRKERPASATGP